MENCRCSCKHVTMRANGVLNSKDKKMFNNGVTGVHHKTRQEGPRLSFTKKNGDGGIGEERELGQLSINDKQVWGRMLDDKEDENKLLENKMVGDKVVADKMVDKMVGPSLDMDSDTTSCSEEESLIGSEMDSKGFFLSFLKYIVAFFANIQCQKMCSSNPAPQSLFLRHPSSLCCTLLTIPLSPRPPH